MKVRYEKPNMDLLEFKPVDIITTSDAGNTVSQQQNTKQDDNIKIAGMKK